MKEVEGLPTCRPTTQAHDVVGELVESIDAAARGDRLHAGAEIRCAVTRGAKLFMAGAIDSQGAALIEAAAANARTAMHARAREAQECVVAYRAVDHQRRISLSKRIGEPPDPAGSVEEARFEALLGLLAGSEQINARRNSTG